jgi:signal transduction histidine kinase
MAECPPVLGRSDVEPTRDDTALVRRGVAVAAGLVLVYAVMPSSWTVLRSVVLGPGAGVGSVACVVIGVGRYRPVAPRAWLLLGAGLAMFTLGFFVTGLYEALRGEDPFPSLSDVFYTAGYPLLAAGLIVAVYARKDSGLDPWAGIDAGIVAAVGALLAWIYLVRPALEAGDLSTGAAVATLAYLLGDLLVFTMTLRFLMATRWRRRWSLCVLAIGFAGTLLGDVSYTLWVIHGTPPLRFWEVALLVGLVASGLAALHPTMRALTEEVGDPAPPPRGRRLAVIMGVGMIPPLLLAVRHLRDEPLYLPATVAVWMALTVLIAARFRRGSQIAQQEADRDAALSRYAADMLQADDRDEILSVARGALDALSTTGKGEAQLELHGEPRASSCPPRWQAPVVVRGEPVGRVVATGAPTTVWRWRASLGAIADQLSMALERDRLLMAERETAESLAEQNERLRELDAMKDKLVSSVSHELRTPLTSIVGFLEILRSGEVGELTPEQVHLVEIIDRNSHRLERTIGDLLVAARLDSGRMRFDMSSVDLAELASRQVESITAVAADKGTRVRLVVEAELPPVWGDEMRLGQLIDNLLSNAVKFSPGGTVTVAVGRRGDQATLAVSDTGVGIPPEDLDKVFDRFYRASTAGTTVGTGLGLSIARSIAEAHGGTIGVTSEVGVGTTFRIELPLPVEAGAPVHERDEVTL